MSRSFYFPVLRGDIFTVYTNFGYKRFEIRLTATNQPIMVSSATMAIKRPLRSMLDNGIPEECIDHTINTLIRLAYNGLL